MTSNTDDEEESAQRLWQSRSVRWSALSGVLLAAGVVTEVTDGPSWLSLVLFVTATGAGARFFAVEAAEELVREREIDIELLMTVAAVVAAALGLWGEAASLAFLYSISEALESFTEGRTRHAIRALLDLAPRQVTRVEPDGSHVGIDIDDLRVGDHFLVRPGQNVATDGTVIDGASAIDESAITGESMPVDKTVGSIVFAGTSNAQGALVVAATATAGDNTLAAIVRLVEQAQQQQGEGEEFMERFARVYSPAVLALGSAVAITGGLLSDNWSRWLERAATVIVAAAPCALVIAIPVTYVAALGRAARNGILIKGGIHLENLGRLDAIALDKTGTITQGRPRVTSIQPVDNLDSDHILAIAAAVEHRSEHPLAQAIVDAATDAKLDLPAANTFEAVTGAGARATIDGTAYTVASPTHIISLGLRIDGLTATIQRAEHAGATAVILANPERPLAVIAIEDTIRPNAPAAIAALRAAGIRHITMLTGDNPRTAANVAASVGITEIEAGLKPADKARIVTELTKQHGTVAMVGDGVNDAPALASAAVGIAMGTAGSDVALETADVALMADDLDKLTTAVHIGRRTRHIVRQNIILSLAILAILVPGALFGLLALPVAVLAHELSELAVILNGVRVTRR
jgi:Cd2+/Zn2+-exporting ATPase